MQPKSITVHLNGESREWRVYPNDLLLNILREQEYLTGTKYGCGVAACGACTVHVDGEAVRSCVTAVGDVAGSVTTIEGLDAEGNHPVQRAWRDGNVPQCGFCQPGQIMQAAALLEANPRPGDQEIVEAMAGNICRCGCYQRILAAVKAAGTGA